MSRRVILLITVLLAGCAKEQKSPESVLPSTIGGRWNRGDIRTPAAVAPDLVEKLGVDSSAETVYQGPGRVLVRVYVMRSDTGAFEAMQKWRQTDAVGIQKGRYFVTASGGSPSDNLAVITELRNAPVQ